MAEYLPVRTGEHFGAQGPSIYCLSCRGILPIQDHYFMADLLGVETTCSKCGETLDLRAIATDIIGDAEVHPFVLGLVGGWTKAFSLIMEPGETALVDLDAMGLPPTARLIQVRLWSANGFIPIEVAPMRWPRMTEPARTFVLHAFPDASRRTETQDFLCNAIHTYPQVNDLVSALVEPFLRLSEGDRRMLPLMLFAVVETGIRRVVRRHYASFTTQGKAKNFARYLRVDEAFAMILPSIAQSQDFTATQPFPKMRDADVENLMTLRDKRNKVSHRLMEDDATTPEIVSTLFGAIYLHFLEQRQLGRLNYLPPPGN